MIGATTFSAQTASLRGLGGQATLILVNGKRMQELPGEVQGVYGVNLDVIPFSAIERVEVLKDGASAIYGSDAIGGVINFIMRQDYQGAEAHGSTARPHAQRRRRRTLEGKVSAGWGDLGKDKYNVFISASYQEQKPLLQSERELLEDVVPPGHQATTPRRAIRSRASSRPAASAASTIRCAPSPAHLASGGRCRFDPRSTRRREHSGPEDDQLLRFGPLSRSTRTGRRT